MNFLRDDELNAALTRLMSTTPDSGTAWEKADSTCSTGFDNDGSTGDEIFENGFDLAVKAAGRPVYAVCSDEEEDHIFFFIGTKEEVLAKIEALP